MMAEIRTALIALGLSFLLLGLAVLGLSVASERPAVNHLAALFSPRVENATWAPGIDRVDEALAVGDVTGAELAWQEAYTAALGSRRWDGMIDVGDASLQIGDAGGVRQASVARARRAYLTALFRARATGSLDGVLRAGEAFEKLGDWTAAEQSVRIAEALVARNGDAGSRERVSNFAARLAHETGAN